ncbi:MAG: chemotaxis protein CheW [Burkholderiaceae bacterium]|nr:chemotaxis protein CheW [Burkholderiaceae bacterium]
MDTPPERRSRLRQYQVQLLERMQAARTDAAGAARALGVLMGGQHYLLDLTQISEIVPRQSLTPVPLTRPWYLGLANIRGQLTGVVDLASYQQGQAPAGALPGQRDITLAAGLVLQCALRVEALLGLRNLAEMQQEAQQESLQELPQQVPLWCQQRYRDVDGQVWTRLDLAQLVREPGFLQVGC